MDNQDKVYQLNELIKYKDIEIAQLKKVIETLTLINENQVKIIEQLKSEPK